MANIQIVTAEGATFEELISFVEECKEKKLPLNTPVKISQHEDTVHSNAVDMQADEESIVFYDWI